MHKVYLFQSVKSFLLYNKSKHLTSDVFIFRKLKVMHHIATAWLSLIPELQSGIYSKKTWPFETDSGFIPSFLSRLHAFTFLPFGLYPDRNLQSGTYSKNTWSLKQPHECLFRKNTTFAIVFFGAGCNSLPAVTVRDSSHGRIDLVKFQNRR